MSIYKNDPKWITSKFNGVCKKCGCGIKAGSLIFYYPLKGAIYCGGTCGQAASADFEAAAFDEEQYLGGY